MSFNFLFWETEYFFLPLSGVSTQFKKSSTCSTFHCVFNFFCVRSTAMATTLHVFHSKILDSPFIASSLTVSLGPLSSQFCWTALAPSPSPSSAPAELCPPRLPSSRRRNRPWIPRPQRSLSRSWMRNCCSLNLTPHLKDEEQFTGTNCNRSGNFNYLFRIP